MEAESQGGVGIYGWRKRCLYAFVLFLFVLVAVNVALTVWIIRVVDFSIKGLGGMHTTLRGIQMTGEVEFLRTLYTSNIKSKPGSNITMESSRKIVMNARDKMGKISSRIVLGPGKITMYTDEFTVKRQNKTLYRVNKDVVQYGGTTLHVTDGAIFRGTVHSPHLQSPPQHNLSVESQTQNVDIQGNLGVQLKSLAGSVNISSYDGVHLTSKRNSIHLNARHIYLPNIPMYMPSSTGRSFNQTYQLCVCKGGRVFVEPAHAQCGDTSDACYRKNKP